MPWSVRQNRRGGNEAEKICYSFLCQSGFLAESSRHQSWLFENEFIKRMFNGDQTWKKDWEPIRAMHAMIGIHQGHTAIIHLHSVVKVALLNQSALDKRWYNNTAVTTAPSLKSAWNCENSFEIAACDFITRICISGWWSLVLCPLCSSKGIWRSIWPFQLQVKWETLT